MQQNTQAVDAYKQANGDYDAFHCIMSAHGYTDMQCLNLHQQMLKSDGWMEPHAFTPKRTAQSKIELSRETFIAVKGNKEEFVAIMMSAHDMTKNVACTYWQNCMTEGNATTIAQLFKQYLGGLEKQDLLAMLLDLVDDKDGLTTLQMTKTLRRQGIVS